MPAPLSLTDQEMAAVLDAAAPIDPARRAAFVEALAAELAKCPVEEMGPAAGDMRDPAPLHRRRWQARPRRASAVAEVPWCRVVFAADCDADGNRPLCGIDYADAALIASRVKTLT